MNAPEPGQEPPDEDLFAREQSVLGDASKILENSNASPEELRNGLKALTRQYDRLLRLTRRLTEMSDNSHRELMEITDFKNQLMGMAAHDIRTPVGIMMGFSQILMEDHDGFSDQQLDFLQKILKQGDGLLRLLDDLLTLSHTESGSMILECEAFNLTQLLSEMTESNRLLAEKKSITLISDFTALETFFADRERLQQVFNNLLGNAIKYSHPNTTVTITLAHENEANQAIITVVDQGLGIPQGELQNIFRPFHRTQNRPTGGEKSTGLGLSIVRRIVEGHGGSIEVESVVGEGSRFIVKLPIKSVPLSPESS